jgi:hypothetical protein
MKDKSMCTTNAPPNKNKFWVKRVEGGWAVVTPQGKVAGTFKVTQWFAAATEAEARNKQNG